MLDKVINVSWLFTIDPLIIVICNIQPKASIIYFNIKFVIKIYTKWGLK